MKFHLYLGFNNYYNRKIKYYNSLEGYQDKLLLTIDNVNFKPNDGIRTSQIVNTVQLVDNEIFLIKHIPDYAVLAEDDGTIVSRWFVQQWTRIREGQYNAELRRDVIADNFNKVIEAPCFIEKATITDKDDIALFNNEDMGFNQIKKEEIMLKDTSLIPWIVGYIPSNQVIGFPHVDEEHPLIPTTVIDPITTLVGNDNLKQWYKVQSNSLQDLYDVPSFPYRVFCIPYADINIWYEGGGITTYTRHTKEIALAIATGIAKSMGSGSIFDVQLLPYCPLRLSNGTNMFVPSKKTYGGEEIEVYDITSMSALTRYYYIYKTNDEAGTDTGDRAGIMFFCNNNKFTFDIDYQIQFPSKALDVKIKNETELYRLCSPNYSGQFDFNPMKNKGLTKFNVDCTYQPFNPYIHINPDFGGLYGEDFNDVRGLICSGDFSLPQETNAWADYQQNNKNFQQMFDRQIQNMEFNNRLARIQQGVQAGVGTLSGVASGAVIGSLVAPGVGTVVGAIGGGLASAAGGVADYEILKAQQKETLDYTKDQFGYQLGNIKALPNNITKTNPFTNNNKIFPVIEKYECSDVELQALKDKLEYNGMTIMRIGKISDWLLGDYSYIKAKLIMIDSNINEDYHTVVEIAAELDKGIRVRGGTE